MFASARKDTFSFVEYQKLSQPESFSIATDEPHVRKKSSKYFNLIIIFGFCVLILALVTVIVNLILNHYSESVESSKGDPAVLECAISENERFDCWPEIHGSSKEKCQSRGCCWKPSSVQSTAPYCFFPSNYEGYSVKVFKENDSGIEATLVRNSSSFYSKDIKALQLHVEYISDFTLRMKVFDPNNKRFEVPLNILSPKSTPKNKQYTVEVEKSPFNICVRRASTGETLFDTRGTAPLIFSDQYLQIATQLSTKYLYGLGEHRSYFLHDLNNWQRLVFWTRDDYPKVDNNGYGSHPFFLNLENGRNENSTGLQNNSHGVFLLNSNAGEVALQPFGKSGGAVTYRFLGGILDYFIMTGPEPVSVISQYISIIGHPYFPPFWSLGFHLCRWGYTSTDRLKQVIKRNRFEQMPYDVQWNDIDYMMNHKDWTYDNKTYSELPAVVKDLHDNNQRYVIIVDPAISSNQPVGSYPPFDDGVKMDVFVKNESGSILLGRVWPGLTAFPDFFHPNASTYLYEQASSFHQHIPFDGLWIDMNEPSNFVDGSSVGCPRNSFNNPPYVPATIDSTSLMAKTVCPSAKQYLSEHYNLHNMYGWSNANVTRTVLKKIFPGKRSLLISRSSFPGSGVFTGHWLGDNSANYEDLFFSIPGILNFNLFGIPQIGADICGFRGSTNPELCTRWMQLGVFYPFMRNHNGFRFPDQDPASFASPYKDYMRSALQLRYKLLSVLYTLFYKAHTVGMPVVRPLLFIYPGTEAINKQLMWGDQLMISPVLKPGHTSVKAYIPNDVWYDFYNNTKLSAVGRYVTLAAPLNHINVHIRGGSVLTLLPPTVRTDNSRKQKFEIVVAPTEKGTAEGCLFWDDGESISSISDGKYSEILFSMQEGNKFVALPKKTGYSPLYGVKLQSIMVLNVTPRPSTVLVNGKNINATYDDSTKTLNINNLDESLLARMDVSWS